jgi:hypothetical protein
MSATWVPLILLVSNLSSGGGPLAVGPLRAQSESGIGANTFMAAVRPFSSGGKDYVIVDAPRIEGMLRMGRLPLYLSFPVAFSWGVRGGFTSEFSIGLGINWSPIRSISVSAQQRVGTFFFNHGTSERTAALDVNLPIRSTTFGGGVTRASAYLVIGVEYFHREVDKWAGFMDREQWYASGDGVAIRVGIRKVSWSF